jgi:hypothetical protein
MEIMHIAPWAGTTSASAACPACCGACAANGHACPSAAPTRRPACRPAGARLQPDDAVDARLCRQPALALYRGDANSASTSPSTILPTAPSSGWSAWSRPIRRLRRSTSAWVFGPPRGTHAGRPASDLPHTAGAGPGACWPWAHQGIHSYPVCAPGAVSRLLPTPAPPACRRSPASTARSTSRTCRWPCPPRN